MPYYAILITCGLLSISVILNYIYKDATKVFVSITTFSTILNIIIWAIIVMSYLGFLKHNPELHKQSNYKMPGGKFMATGILIFFAFIFIVLLISNTTRWAVLLSPVWLGILCLMYLRYRKETKIRNTILIKSNINTTYFSKTLERLEYRGPNKEAFEKKANG